MQDDSYLLYGLGLTYWLSRGVYGEVLGLMEFYIKGYIAHGIYIAYDRYIYIFIVSPSKASTITMGL